MDPTITQDNSQKSPISQTTSVSPTTPNDPEPKRKSKFLKIFFLAFFLLILTTTSVGAALIAYEKVHIPYFPNFQKQIRHFVQGLPLLPKTPKFLLEKTALAHQENSKNSYDASITFDSSELIELLGLTSLNFQAKGAIDYTNQNKLKYVSNIAFADELDIDIKKNADQTFFKINKVPSILLTYLALPVEQLNSITNRWVEYESVIVQIEKSEGVPQQSQLQQDQFFLENSLEKYFDDEVYESLVIKRAKENNYPVYKISFNPSDEMVDRIGEKIGKSYQEKYPLVKMVPDEETYKLSAALKNVNLQISIDRKSYFTRKILFSCDIEFDQEDFGGSIPNGFVPTADNTLIGLTFLATLNNFGEGVAIQPPPMPMSYEEFILELSSLYQETLDSEVSESTESQSSR